MGVCARERVYVCRSVHVVVRVSIIKGCSINPNIYDSDLPHAKDKRNLAFSEQTKQPGTPIGC